jgi:chromate transporter
VGAAVAGVVLNLAVWFSLHTLFSAVDEIQVGPVTLQVPEPASLQLPALAIAVLAAILLLRYRMATLKVLALSAFMGALLAVAIR